MSFSRVDLVLHGAGPPPDWRHGETTRIEASPAALAAALAAVIDSDGSLDDRGAVLLWERGRPLPDAGVLALLSGQPVDLWHAGLRLGTAGLPRLLDRTRPTWMHNRDPEPSRAATSWRLHPGATLIRSSALRPLGGPDATYTTLLGCGLDLGHRYLRSGAITRFEPSLLPPAATEAATGQPTEPSALPLEDEIRFIRRRFGDRWARWATLRAILSGVWSAGAVRRAWRDTDDTVREPPLRLAPRRRASEAPPTSAAVTVLVPTLDRYGHLDKLLAQLPLQSLPPAEVIVVDQTPVERRRPPSGQPPVGRPPVRWIVRERAGQCSSRNHGLSIAEGDYVLFLDDDDDDLPTDLIASHLGNLSAYGADASCGVVEESGAGPTPPDFALFRVSDVLPTNNCMIRRTALERSGLFDLAYERGARADADLGMRLYLSGALAVLDPRISLRHLRSATGGLRTWGARRRTYAAARRSLWRRHLPSVTEIYLFRRYFSTTQVRERLWIAAGSTLAGSGPVWRRAVTAGLGLLAMPLTLLRLWRRFRASGRLLDRFPRIPTLAAEHRERDA